MNYTDETFYRAVQGDKRAVDATIRQFTPLVHKWVRKYKFMAQDNMYEDLVQEGLMGIVKAVQTFDMDYRFKGKPIKPITWIWHQVRGSVQSAARRQNKFPKYSLSLEQSDWGMNLEDSNPIELRDDKLIPNLEEIFLQSCGSMDSKRAKIVRDRFGLFGAKPMLQGEVARKYGLSKQATNGHIARFCSSVRQNHPELRELI
jgi:RNA polymerase sigma factor (sigma-70 family)